MTSIRVALPAHLRNLAGVGREVTIELEVPATVTSVLDALEAAHPALRGTIREHGSGARRAFMRYFADGEDISLGSPDDLLPGAVAEGREPLRIVGAIAGG